MVFDTIVCRRGVTQGSIYCPMCAQKSRSIVDRFPQLLRKVRTDKGLSQEELADLAGLHRTYISQIERGLKSPSLRSLEQIANGLEITLSELLRRLEA